MGGPTFLRWSNRRQAGPMAWHQDSAPSFRLASAGKPPPGPPGASGIGTPPDHPRRTLPALRVCLLQPALPPPPLPPWPSEWPRGWPGNFPGAGADTGAAPDVASPRGSPEPGLVAPGARDLQRSAGPHASPAASPFLGPSPSAPRGDAGGSRS